MKSLNFLLSILIVIAIYMSFCSCNSKDYHSHSQITLVENSVEITEFKQTQEPNTTPNKNNVYYTKSGKCYHYINPCGRGTYFECTLEEAKDKGLLPCDKCVK